MHHLFIHVIIVSKYRLIKTVCKQFNRSLHNKFYMPKAHLNLFFFLKLQRWYENCLIKLMFKLSILCTMQPRTKFSQLGCFLLSYISYNKCYIPINISMVGNIILIGDGNLSSYKITFSMLQSN